MNFELGFPISTTVNTQTLANSTIAGTRLNIFTLPLGPWPSWNLNAYVTARHTSYLGESWTLADMGYAMGKVLLPPKPSYPNCSTLRSPTTRCATPRMFGLASAHPAGANVLLCDGSVRFLKDSTSRQVIWALGSRAQGEIISADAC